MNCVSSFNSAPLEILAFRLCSVSASSGRGSAASTSRKVCPSPCARPSATASTKSAASTANTFQLENSLIARLRSLERMLSVKRQPLTPISTSLLTTPSLLTLSPQPYHNLLRSFPLTPQSTNATIHPNNSVRAAHGSFCHTSRLVRREAGRPLRERTCSIC